MPIVTLHLTTKPSVFPESHSRFGDDAQPLPCPPLCPQLGDLSPPDPAQHPAPGLPGAKGTLLLPAPAPRASLAPHRLHRLQDLDPVCCCGPSQAMCCHRLVAPAPMPRAFGERGGEPRYWEPLVSVMLPRLRMHYQCLMIMPSLTSKCFLMAFMMRFSESDTSYHQPTKLGKNENVAKMLHFR